MKSRFSFFILFLLLLIPLWGWFHPGFPITHDGQDHIARIANFYQSLQDGILVPRWAENLNWGYGHPILMFLYPMPSYMASIFHFVGFSFVDSTKLVFVFAFVLSGLTMYLWCKEFLSKEAAFVGALLYTFAPYRFIDLYVRGAIGEHVAFIFPPLVFYFLLRLSKKFSVKDIIWGSFSLGLLILSHNAISLMFIPVIFVYAIYLFFQAKQRKVFLITTFVVIFFGFCLSAFFWVPALIEGKYTLRDIVTQGSFAQNFSSWIKFFYGEWSYGGSGSFTVQVGILQWLSVLLAVPASISFYREKKSIWLLSCGTLFIFVFTLFLMNGSSEFLWNKITLIQKFQFPWRFLSVTVFSTGLLGALVVFWLPKKYKIITVSFFVIGLLIQNSGYWHANGYLYKPEVFYSGIYSGTTDTGESAPIWSVRFMEHTATAHMEVISGRAKITELKRTSVDHSYRVSADGKVQLKENTLYFPDWTVFVDGISTPIQYQDAHNRGLLTFYVSKGVHHIEVKFSETKLRVVSDMISVISLFVLMGWVILNREMRDVRRKI